MLHWKIDVRVWSRRVVAWGIAMAAVGASALLAAQAPQQPFEKFTAESGESLPAEPLVIGAYAFVWVALVVYVFMLWRRIGRVEQELADVTARLAKRQ